MCDVPVAGFTNMLPGGMPFSAMKAELGGVSSMMGGGEERGQAGDSL